MPIDPNLSAVLDRADAAIAKLAEVAPQVTEMLVGEYVRLQVVGIAIAVPLLLTGIILMACNAKKLGDTNPAPFIYFLGGVCMIIPGIVFGSICVSNLVAPHYCMLRDLL